MKQHKQTLVHLRAACHNLLTATEQGNKPRIAAWGLVKAGKSSLLNMLSEHVGEEFFATGAVRTTRKNKALETERFVLVDTPGLGIDDDDSKNALEGLEEADITLFVHAPPGELDLEEIHLLAQVKAAYGKQTERRLILVISQLDKHADEALESIRTRILAQMQERFGIRPACFTVSNTRYRKGVLEDKTGLQQKSGIPLLRQHLDDLSTEIGDELESLRATRRAKRKSELLTELDKAIDEERELVASLQKPFLEQIRQFNWMMTELRRSFTSHRADIENVQLKLKSL